MAFSLIQTREWLKKIEKIPQKTLGQNFLVDPNIVQQSIHCANLQTDESVVEIGPGLGILTDALLKQNAKVYAVEKDPRLFHFLTEQFSNVTQLNLMLGDAVKSPVAQLPKNVKNFKVVANLPYSIASVWLEQILALETLPDTMVLMVQKEGGERWIAPSHTKKFSPIAIFLQSSYMLASKTVVPKKSFYPQPKVDSWLMHFEKKAQPLCFSESFRGFLRHLFTRRRQQLGRLCRENQKLAWYSELSQFLSEKKLTLTHRAEEIQLEVWQEFYCTTTNT